MEVNSLSGHDFCATKVSRFHANTFNLKKNLNNNGLRSNITFGNQPWRLDPVDYGVSRYGEITGREGIRLYEQLKSGNYLDIGNDKFDFINCNRIREENLSFLDRIKYSPDQRHFLQYYKDLTGFPDLKKVSNKIKNEFVKAVDKSSRDMYSSATDVLLAGYDGVCSVGRGNAFAGSDIDKAYVVIRGNTGLDETELVNRFKGRIWQNTDQRILSYNHDEASFPQVYTKYQIEKLTEVLDEKDYPHRRLQLNHQSVSDVYIEQDSILHNMWGFKEPKYMDDYVKANPFWVKYCKEFHKAGDDIVRTYWPSRENIKNLGFVLEAIREGEILRGCKTNLNVTERFGYEMANLSQLSALKNLSDRKPKRLARNNLMYEFPLWDLDKQFRFVKTMIKSACANNRNFTYEFGKYYSKPGQDMFASLIKALMG